MRVRSVTAHAFGAIDETTLEFGEDLNIIVGPNGTGKSTWHAAIYAALTGKPGDATMPVDRRLRRRRPRTRGAWAVAAEIERADGRTVRITQDLARPHDSIATDADTAADLAPGIRHEDGLDATRWLGLDRRSFAATAYVEQAYGLLASPDDTSGKALQRAIASGGGEATVTEAVERIARHRRRVVGDLTDPESPIGRALTDVLDANAAQAELTELGQRRPAQQRLVELAEHDLALARDDLTAGQIADAQDAVVQLESRLDEAVRAERAHTEKVLAAPRPTIDPRVEEAAARYLSAPSVTDDLPADPTARTSPARSSVGGWLAPAGVGLVGVAAMVGSAVAGNLAGFISGVVVLLVAAVLSVPVVLRPAPASASLAPIESVPSDILDQRERELRDALAAAGAGGGTR